FTAPTTLILKDCRATPAQLWIRRSVVQLYPAVPAKNQSLEDNQSGSISAPKFRQQSYGKHDGLTHTETLRGDTRPVVQLGSPRYARRGAHATFDFASRTIVATASSTSA